MSDTPTTGKTLELAMPFDHKENGAKALGFTEEQFDALAKRWEAFVDANENGTPKNFTEFVEQLVNFSENLNEFIYILTSQLEQNA